MPSDLDFLIDYYQWEIRRIGSLIEEHKESQFYEEVILDDKALQKAHSELDKLLALKNPNHHRIELLQIEISSMKRMEQGMFDRYGALYDSTFIKDEIRVRENEVKELTRATVRNRDETQYIDDALYKLIENTLKTVTISIDSYGSKLIISIVKLEELGFKTELYLTDKRENYTLKNRDAIKELRFVFDVESERYQSVFTLHSKNNILPYKEYLSRLIYGLKRYLELGNQLYINLD